MSKFRYEIKRINGAKSISEIARVGGVVKGCRECGKTLVFYTPKRRAKDAEKSLNTRLIEYKREERKNFFERFFSLCRLGVFITLFICVFAYLFLSQFLFFTEIRGLDKVSVKKVEKHLASMGISGMVKKSEVDKDMISESLLSEFSFSVVSVDIEGVTLVLRLKEELSAPIYDLKKEEYLVSAENALVTRVVTISGTPEVKEGESVIKGEILIKNSRTVGETRYDVRAVGEVYGRVWREVEIFVPERVESLADTGVSVRVNRLNFSKNLEILSSPYPFWRVEDEVTPFALLPIYHHSLTFFEQRVVMVKNPEYTDTTAVKRRAQEKLNLLLADVEHELIRTWIEEKEVEGGKTVKVIAEIEKRIDVYPSDLKKDN